MVTAAPAPLWHPMLIEGALALHDNRIPEAERLLKGYLKQDPFDARAIRMLAEVAGRIGRYRDAENLLRRAIELAPGSGRQARSSSPRPSTRPSICSVTRLSAST